MSVYVITYPTPKDIKSLVNIHDSDTVIAVDQAVYHAYKQRIKIDLAVGDFDSLKNQGLLHGMNVEKLPVKKDVTDTFYALQKAYSLSEDVFLIGGACGDRIEHMYAHLQLFHHFPTLKIYTEHSELHLVNKDTQLSFKGFVNIFPYPSALISLEGFEYNLNAYDMKPHDILGISNKVTHDIGTIRIHEGTVLLILTRQ